MIDMMAIDFRSSIVMVAIQDMGRAIIPIDKLIEELKSGLETADGFETVFHDTSDIAIGINTYYVVSIDADLRETKFEQHLLFRSQGNYMIIVTISLFGDITFDEIIAAFH